jgi:hypothetical protein
MDIITTHQNMVIIIIRKGANQVVSLDPIVAILRDEQIFKVF